MEKNKERNLFWVFFAVSIILVFIGIIKNDFLWYIRAGIVLIGGIVYYFLVKNGRIGKKFKGKGK